MEVPMEQITHMVDVTNSIVTADDIEIYSEPNPADFWEEDFVDPGWNEDVDGTGLVVFVYEGKRSWVKTTISKTPFNYMRKALQPAPPENLKHVYVIRGNMLFPLMDAEIKSLSGLIINRLKDTSLAGFSTYTTVSSLSTKMLTMLNHVVDNFVSILEEAEYDLTVHTPNSVEEDIRNGTTVFKGAGYTATVSLMLKDENDPSQGAGFISVRVNDATGGNLLTTTVGSLLNSTPGNN